MRCLVSCSLFLLGALVRGGAVVGTLGTLWCNVVAVLRAMPINCAKSLNTHYIRMFFLFFSFFLYAVSCLLVAVQSKLCRGTCSNKG